MSWLRIVHETTYRYNKAVGFGPHRLVLRPREGHDVRVHEMRLEIAPEFELEWSRDLFGNSVATVHFLTNADCLRIRSEVVLQQTVPFPLRRTASRSPVRYPLQFSTIEAALASAYVESTCPDDVARVREWTAAVIDTRTLNNAEEVVAAVARTIRDSIKYRRREEKGVQTPTETIEAGSGSCRDMATLMLEVLRALGLPARFASGYLDCAASEAGRASTHAWAEAYLPELGWTGYDPMMGGATSEKHIVTGVSNHPRGVMPVSGTFYDGREAYVGMEVAVQITRTADREELMRASPAGS
jgi:transglutaminase-like putative cysteine protease